MKPKKKQFAVLGCNIKENKTGLKRVVGDLCSIKGPNSADYSRHFIVNFSLILDISSVRVMYEVSAWLSAGFGSFLLVF